MEPYEIFLNQESLRRFSECSVRQRGAILRFDQLAANPELPPDFTHSGPHQIALQTKRFGDWKLTYRIDSPVKQVQVIGIEKLSS